jgi:predicted dehydrogenase
VSVRRSPRLGFLGVGWIGRNRLEAVVRSEHAAVVALCDPSEDAIAAARVAAPEARRVADLDELLALDLDGVVIATPSADHAEQSIHCLEAGTAVFCQKPLGRTADEVSRVVSAAERSGRLLGVDLSYRATAAGRALREEVARGSLGQLFAADLVFHNAYGPDRAWFYDARLSGGGCVMDLGIHLVDLLLWTLDFPSVLGVKSRLIASGRPIRGRDGVEDYATAELTLAEGLVARLACSWRLHAGQDAVIGASLHGSEGGVCLRDVGGSFYDFETLRFRGTRREVLASPPDPWSGRAAVEWAGRLAEGKAQPELGPQLVAVARVLDRIYDAA